MTFAIGIDLGTTSSVVAVSEDGKSRVLRLPSGDWSMPSVVGYQRVVVGDDRIIVGKTAANNAVRAPAETVFGVKRLMGRTADDPQLDQVKRHAGFEIRHDADASDLGLRIPLGDQIYSPVDISAEILRELKIAAELELGGSVTQAVVTVPAYFEERQRAATRAAAEKAGLTVKKIIDEPTAAAVGFGASQPGSRKRVLVYDLGGGTFDVSIIQWVDDQYQVIAIEGDNWLGGDDFDREIVTLISAAIEREHGLAPADDIRFRILAQRHAETAKIALGRLDDYELIVPGITRDRNGQPVDLDLAIARDELETLIAPYLERTMDLVRRLLARQDLAPSDIDEVLLVGGSTAIPLIQSTVTDFFGAGRVKRHLDPIHCVALGAAVLAEQLRGTECGSCGTYNPEHSTECRFCHALLAGHDPAGRIGLREVTARSLGIGCKDDVYAVIIPSGTPYPLRQEQTEVFYPTVQGQQRIQFPVYEGEAQPASINSLQGMVDFGVDPPMPLDTPIRVTFNYDQDRVLQITVRPSGRQPFHEVLVRCRPSVAMGLGLGTAGDWGLEVERAIQLGRDFIAQCGSLLAEPAVADLRRTIEQARAAITRGDAQSARAAAQRLRWVANNNGLASLLFAASRIAVGLDADRRTELSSLVTAIRAAADADDKAELHRLAQQLSALMDRILQHNDDGDRE
jgi:molecular chaperone DnaK